MQKYQLVGRDLETPLVNAAGSINGTSKELMLREVSVLADSAIGAITVGSFTVPEQLGNEVTFGGPTYYHDKETGATYNSMGLPNIGLAAARLIMPRIILIAHEKGKPVIASVSPIVASPSHGDTFEQTVRLVETLAQTGVDLIEVNTSCPNVVTEAGGRKPILGYDLEGMEKLIDRLHTELSSSTTKIGLKLPPYISEEERETIAPLARILNQSPTICFVTTANTIPNQVARNKSGGPVLSVPGGAGGMSGGATRQVGRDQLVMWHELLGSRMDIVSTLGVDGGKELAVRRKLGATAGGGVTMFWEEADWGSAVTKTITEWVESGQP